LLLGGLAAVGPGAGTSAEARAATQPAATLAIAQVRSADAAGTPASASAAAAAPAAAGAAAGAAVAVAPPAELIDPAGLRKLLAAQRGKVVVLNLWATWCVPCLREIPDLVALEKELAPRGVTLIGLGMDEPSALAGQVEPFRRKNFPAFRTWLRSEADMDALVSVVDPAWNEILPTTYLIGRDGKLARKVQGKRTLEQFRELIQEVP
jgi:thiol-disulfide isomerase/thioredoxin